MAQILFVSGRGSAVAQNLGTLFLLLLLLPFNLAVVIFYSIIGIFRNQTKRQLLPEKDRKRILITGGKMTKALQLARSFQRVGHEVYLVETHKYWLIGHRFSRAVTGFCTVPVPQKDPEGYCQSLLEIVKENNINVFIPVSSPIASYYDSLAKKTLEPYCEGLHFDPEVTQILDDKYKFCKKAQEIGLSAPKVFRFTSPQQIIDFDFENNQGQYIIKSIPYDSVRRRDLVKLPFVGMESYLQSLPITEEKPWVMQEFIKGQEYCFHATVRKGKIRLHCCSESSPFQVNYEQTDNPAIYEWVEKFVREMNLTGQICFDMIQTPDGTVYPIECNPRLHSAITMFHDHPGLAQAYLEDGEETIKPLPNSKPTYWTYHELWRLTEIRSLSDIKTWWQKVTQGTDAVLHPEDPLPFFMLHNWQIPLLLLDNLRRLKGWLAIDFNIGKLVELGGD
ncbi:MAG: ATP-grasp domain-containing protein [Xenococcaceae cyanobacterium MO_207.B15]|nr:ATP-grasp domain-containing protein [Xenococcaceae cyanobacterium MO_207.B15]